MNSEQANLLLSGVESYYSQLDLSNSDHKRMIDAFGTIRKIISDSGNHRTLFEDDLKLDEWTEYRLRGTK